MNAGARAAVNDHLLFLHADCRLPPDAFDAIHEVFSRGHTAGVFSIDFGSPHVILWTLSRLSRWPTRWTQFGEGALFIQRATFEAVGGFPDWPLMEDVEILRRLRRRTPVIPARRSVRASPRRFLENGVTRQMLRNLLCYALFQLGMAPERLLRWYTGKPISSAQK
jgi:hypothetical protein